MLIKEIESIDKKMKKEKITHEDWKNLNNLLHKLQDSSSSDERDIEEAKAIIKLYDRHKKQLSTIKKQIEDVESDCKNVKSQRNEIDETLKQGITKLFNNNDISIELFDKSSKAIFEIYHKNIYYTDLNTAMKHKLSIKINEILNIKDDISTFIILDHFKSFSTFDSDCQIICARAENKGLTLEH